MENLLYAYTAAISADIYGNSLRLIIGWDNVSALIMAGDTSVVGARVWGFDHGSATTTIKVNTIRNKLIGEPLLSRPFRRVEVAWSVPAATAIPNRLFSPAHGPDYLQYLTSTGAYSIAFTCFQASEIQLVYGVPEPLHGMVAALFPGLYQTHLFNTLFDVYHKLTPASGCGVFVNIRPSQAQMMVFDRGNLIFLNTFHWNHPHDLLYAVLLVFDQHKLDTKEVALNYCGVLTPDNSRLLSRYIAQLNPVAISSFEFPFTFPDFILTDILSFPHH